MAHTGQRHSGHEAHFIGICFGNGVFTAWPESRHQTVAAPSFGACPCTDPRPAPSPPGTALRTPTGLMAARDDAARWGRETTSTNLRLAYREAAKKAGLWLRHIPSSRRDQRLHFGHGEGRLRPRRGWATSSQDLLVTPVQKQANRNAQDQSALKRNMRHKHWHST